MIPTETTPLVLLAGIPGAGKTEALRMMRRDLPQLRISDPETVRSWLRRRAPWLPYAIARPGVHTSAHILALFQILRRGGGPLIVHDPGTRRWSRRLILRLALLKGYRPAAVYIDIDRDTALRGQVQRQRVVRPRAFDRHWRHWLELRSILADDELPPGERWPQVVVSSRDSVLADVAEVLRPINEPLELPVRTHRARS